MFFFSTMGFGVTEMVKTTMILWLSNPFEVRLVKRPQTFGDENC